jgi:hypothetical protein
MKLVNGVLKMGIKKTEMYVTNEENSEKIDKVVEKWEKKLKKRGEKI